MSGLAEYAGELTVGFRRLNGLVHVWWPEVILTSLGRAGGRVQATLAMARMPWSKRKDHVWFGTIMPNSLPDPATTAALAAERVLILDFGSQVTQLIARRLRELGVYCEIWPFNADPDRIRAWRPRGIILSGGPASLTEGSSPRAPQCVFEAGVPVLGICYGMQTMCDQLGGEVQGSDHREFGRAFVELTDDCVLFQGVWHKGGREQVWMSHGDRVTRLPPGFRVVGVSEGAPFAAVADDSRRFYGLLFHPEVVHTPHGAALLRNFTHGVLGLSGTWTMAGFRATEIARIRAEVGQGRVICGLSGGVDSSVAAVLIHEAIGDQLTCIFVDHGLLRQGEAEEVVRTFRDRFNIRLVHRDASALFLDALDGVTDPEAKRKTIGRLFIDVFDEEAGKLGGADYLAQGTLYPDVIESVSFTGGPSVTIKSHHNVGGLPERMRLKLIEPLRELFKDEVRALGRELGIPDSDCGAASVSRAGAGDPHSRARSRGRNWSCCGARTRSSWRRSARLGCTMRSGRHLPCCCRCGPWA